MYCPGCGEQTHLETKYCRSCGMDLKIMSQVFAAQPKTLGEQQPAKETERRRTLKWGFMTFWGGILLAALFAIMGEAILPISHRLGIFVENLAPLGGLVLMLGIGIMIYSLFLPKSAPVKSEVNNEMGRARHQPQLPSEPYRQPVRSVTERTTELFEQSDPSPAMRDRSRRSE